MSAHRASPDSSDPSPIEAARRGSPLAVDDLLEAQEGFLRSVARHHPDAGLRDQAAVNGLTRETIDRARNRFRSFLGQGLHELRIWLLRLLGEAAETMGSAIRATEPAEDAAGAGARATFAALPSTRTHPPRVAPSSGPWTGRVVQLVEGLPALHRDVLLLRYRDGLSLELVSRRLGIDPDQTREVWLEALERFAEARERGEAP